MRAEYLFLEQLRDAEVLHRDDLLALIFPGAQQTDHEQRVRFLLAVEDVDRVVEFGPSL